MRRITWMSCILILVLVAAAVSVRALPQLSGSKTKLSSGSSRSLTDKEIEELKSEWTDESTGHKYLIRIGFGVPQLNEDTKARCIKKGKVPYRFTASLYRFASGETSAKLFKNDLHFYVLDSSGKTAEKTITKSSMVMCPS